MELVRDAAGDPAPRLNDLELTPEQAREWHAFMMRQIVLMLCAGLIHGDLSEFNVLVDATGPVSAVGRVDLYMIISINKIYFMNERLESLPLLPFRSSHNGDRPPGELGRLAAVSAFRVCRRH